MIHFPTATHRMVTHAMIEKAIADFQEASKIMASGYD